MPRYCLFKKCEQRNNNSAAHSNNYGATADIKDQASGNYVYNAIGELNYDRISSIDSVKWNVYGKIQHIYRHAATYGTAATGLHYYYDPSGNRVGRAVLYNPSTSYNSYTWYVRDAQGNVLAAYRTIGSDITTSTLKLIEHHMYGSSRLGIINRDMDVDKPRLTADNSNANLGTAYLSIFTRGNKLFELTNHLGNVLVTVTDVKTPTPKSGTPSQVGGYIANMVVATDYTPFGMIMQGRNYNNAAGDKYRYGFNGKEYDNAVKGTGNEIDYGERPYDPMGGRFLSVDKVTKDYPWISPYAYTENSPIANIDLDGLEKVRAPGLATTIWNAFTGDNYKTRAQEFAAKNNIDEGNIYYLNNTQVTTGNDTKVINGYGGSVVIYQPVLNKETGETIEYKHIFYSANAASNSWYKGSNQDVLYQKWDLYWDDEGRPIFTTKELSEPTMDAPIGGGTGKAAGGVAVLGGAGKTAKAWTIYQFIDKANDFKQYTGLTVEYLRRISQHAGRVLKGTEDVILKGIPNKDLARGVEQLFIEYGKKVGEISNKINSINPKGKNYQSLIDKAVQYMKKNHSNLDYLWKDRK